MYPHSPAAIRVRAPPFAARHRSYRSATSRNVHRRAISPAFAPGFATRPSAPAPEQTIFGVVSNGWPAYSFEAKRSCVSYFPSIVLSASDSLPPCRALARTASVTSTSTKPGPYGAVNSATSRASGVP